MHLAGEPPSATDLDDVTRLIGRVPQGDFRIVVRAKNSELIGLDVIDAIHASYAQRRDSLIPTSHTGHRPSAGVGGTRRGVKCLHAHFAHWLAGGNDAVGEWVAQQLDAQGIERAERI
jgi:hypothetical protein